MSRTQSELVPVTAVDLEDIIAAMTEAGGYLDITPNDALLLYRVAYAHAFERLSRSVGVRQVMTTQVVSVDVDSPVVEALQRMAEARVSGVPVLHDRELVGVLSIKDVLVKLGLPKQASAVALVAELAAGRLCREPSLEGLRVRDIMSAPAISLGSGASVAEAAECMSREGINRLPILDGAKLVGLVTREDVVRASGLSQNGGRR